MEGSFISLLNGSFEDEDFLFSQPPPHSQSQSQTQTQTQTQLKPQQEGGKTKKGKRSKNFLIEEDMLLISAWLNISMDPVQGNNQTHTSYWKRIWEYFNENKEGLASDRTTISLCNRWCTINEKVAKFIGFYNKIIGRNESGLTEQDKGLIKDVDKVTANENVLACPICYEPFESISETKLSVNTSAQSSFHCCTCRKEYFGNETHLNLTVASGSNAYDESMPASTEIFRTPVVSFLYERGWRQTFSVLGGFPGAEKEFEMMKDYLKPVLGGNIIDASCGSGMFSRLFAKSGLFSRVVALDFSENMLQECFKFIKEEENFPTENLILVRADISRLPFATSSIDAVHAGAALHCWPSPSAAVAEISRVLRPGGVFVATTYILDGLYSLIPLLGSVRQIIGEISGSHIFLSEGELKELCAACGLLDFTVVRNRRFVMISARKPN